MSQYPMEEPPLPDSIEPIPIDDPAEPEPSSLPEPEPVKLPED